MQKKNKKTSKETKKGVPEQKVMKKIQEAQHVRQRTDSLHDCCSSILVMAQQLSILAENNSSLSRAIFSFFPFRTLNCFAKIGSCCTVIRVEEPLSTIRSAQFG